MIHLAASLLAAQPAVAPEEAVAAVEAQRARFNSAIAEGNADTIAALLANDVVLVAGTSSTLFVGRQAQVDLWAQDFAQPGYDLYVRTPTAITPSPLLAMASEQGTWRGTDPANAANWAAGTYTAKWRLIDGSWKPKPT